MVIFKMLRLWIAIQRNVILTFTKMEAANTALPVGIPDSFAITRFTMRLAIDQRDALHHLNKPMNDQNFARLLLGIEDVVVYNG